MMSGINQSYYNDPRYMHKHHLLRFFVISDWLSIYSRINEYSKLIVTDFRDMIFQSNPFNQIREKGVYTFEEQFYLKDNEWNQKWLTSCLGQNFTNALLLKNFRVICVGVVMGCMQDMLVYTKTFVDVMRSVEIAPAQMKDCLHGFDTAVHYEIMLNQLAKYNVTARIVTVGMGETSHMLRDPYRSDGAGRIVNDNDEPYAMIHQADRHDDLWKRFIAEYDN
jgi:hypothetical protein